MRNKNVVVMLLVVFSAICLFNLFHTYRAFSYEAELDNASEIEREQLLKDSEFMDGYRNSQDNSFTLGLDLQGGMFVTMEIGVDELISELAGPAADADFDKALKNAKIRKQDSQESLVDLFYESLKEVNPNANMATYFSSEGTDFSFNTSDDEVLEYLNERADAAIENTFGIIRTRIDQFGVASPNLQLQEGTGRILIELPGVREGDEERVRKLLRNTAKLEFWETLTFSEGYSELMKLNDVVKRIKGFDTDSTSTDSANADPNAIPAVPVADDGGLPSLDAEDDEPALADNDTAGTGDTSKGTSANDLLDLEDDDLTAAVEDTLSSEEQEAEFLQNFPMFEDFVFPQQAQLQGYPNTPIMGYMRENDTSKFNQWLRHPELTAIMPSDVKFLWTAKADITNDDNEGFFALIAIKSNVEDKAPLGGEVITKAGHDFNDQGGTDPIVNMSMNAEGSKIWKDMTADNIGKSVAVVMDNRVYSYPRVNSAISGGRTQIEGSFTIDEAKDLATLLSSGQLPVKARIQGEEIVGPTLGAENITNGFRAFIAAFFLTIVFMVFYYNKSGMVASIALLANVLFILGVSGAMGVVLTLPGIAAIVLTMGMAVDANVLIFERIREEQALGKSLKASITSGFRNAFSSVMDANITTFLTGVVLFAFGVGPIRGFAVNLMIGIATSLISALFITRLILDIYSERGNDSMNFGSKLTLNIFKNMDIKMTVRKKVFYVVSGILMLASVGSFIYNGFKTGVDFKGGRQYVLDFESEPNIEATRTALTLAFNNQAPVIKTIGTGNQLLITTSYLVEEQDKSKEVQILLMDNVTRANGGSEPSIVSQRLVGPTVANDIQRSAVKSVIFSLLIIFLYILVRFRKWQYSLGALASLVHDVVITLGFFSILGALDFLPFSLEIDQAFIAAILTIVGYSINDTVVVFDRIRENLSEMKTKSLSEVYDASINQTLSRTLITSLTTLFTVLILFVLGGDTIKGFMFALLVGVVFGTYSSIFVASPISHDLMLTGTDKQEQGQKKSVKA